jgi:predicted 2-oxoglutarate/Fe(II)-dependent dioxygenase YbiX
MLCRPEQAQFFRLGELVVEDTYGAHNVKLPAGHMILYPASKADESGWVDGSFHVVVEACPHCGKEARQSTFT